jgi:hypothetical protein
MKRKGTIFKRKDDRYLPYLPVRVVDDSMFPLKCNGFMPVKVGFRLADGKLMYKNGKSKTPKQASRATIYLTDVTLFF